MKIKRVFFLLAILLVSTLSLFGQEYIDISGRVTDSNGQGLYRVAITAYSSGCDRDNKTTVTTNHFGYYFLSARVDCAEFVGVTPESGKIFIEPIAYIFYDYQLTKPLTGVDFYASNKFVRR